MIGDAGPVPKAVMVVLLGFSLFSFTIFFSKFGAFRAAHEANRRFLDAFRKNPLEAMAVGFVPDHIDSKPFKASPFPLNSTKLRSTSD